MSDAKAISVLGICGSLRKGSFNHAALNTAIELRPPGMTVTVADISQIPLYNEDVRVQGFPPPVETLRQQIKAADALLFASPEYNYSMSGVLKNATDGPRARPTSRSRASRSRSSAPPPAWLEAPGRKCICAIAASFSTCTRLTSPRC